MLTVTRHDRYLQVDALDVDGLKPPVEGPGGAWIYEGFVARPGIYVYANPDGTIRRELVPESTISDPEALATLPRAPVTLEHPTTPDGLVDPDTVARFMHGDVGDIADVTPSKLLKTAFTLRTRAAQDAFKGGKQQLSPGYTVVLDPTPGVDPEYGEYDAIQRSRRYNHLALVDRARGGENMRARADSESPNIPVLQDVIVRRVDGKESPSMDPKELQDKLDALQASLDACNKRMDEMQSKMDALQAPPEPEKPAEGEEDPETEEVSEDAAEPEPAPPEPEPGAKADSFDVQAWYVARRKMEDLAASYGVPFTSAMTNAQLAAAVADKAVPGARADGLDAEAILTVLAKIGPKIKPNIHQTVREDAKSPDTALKPVAVPSYLR